LLGAIVGFLIPNLATYARSWDIVKFFGAGEFFANILFADLVAASLSALALRGRWQTRALAVSIFTLATFSTWIWLLRYSVFDGNLAPLAFGPPEIEVGEALLDFLGTDRIHPKTDRVLSTNIDVGRGSGLGTPGVVRGANTFLIDEPRNLELSDALGRARHHLGEADLLRLGIRWVVFSAGDIEALAPEGRAAIGDPRRFQYLGEFHARNGETRRVWEVVRAEGATASH
jgi:hypothetical protein